MKQALPFGLIFLFSLLCSPLLAQTTTSESYSLLRGAYHIHTKYSCGTDTMREVVEQAQSMGLDFVIFSDHDRGMAEYGIFPLQHWICKRETSHYKIRNNVQAYFEEAEALNHEFPDVIVMAGLEVSPHYYWKGNPITGLTVSGLNRHVVVLDMPTLQDYIETPVPHNPGSRRYRSALLPPFLFALALAILAAINTRPRYSMTHSWIRWPLLLLSLAIAWNQSPIGSLPYNQYHDYGDSPYQSLIQYVEERGGIALWAHMEGTQGWEHRSDKYNVHFDVTKNLDQLQSTTGATGFALLYGDVTTMDKPGQTWDQHLLDYTTGRRHDISFGMGEIDYNGVNADLDYVQTAVLVQDRSSSDIYDAIRQGRMFATRGLQNNHPLLQFTLSDSASTSSWHMGEEATITGKPVLIMAVDKLNAQPSSVTLQIIKNGIIVYETNDITPYTITWTDNNYDGSAAYYRVIAQSNFTSTAMSNPIFCNRK